MQLIKKSLIFIVTLSVIISPTINCYAQEKETKAEKAELNHIHAAGYSKFTERHLLSNLIGAILHGVKPANTYKGELVKIGKYSEPNKNGFQIAHILSNGDAIIIPTHETRYPILLYLKHNKTDSEFIRGMYLVDLPTKYLVFEGVDTSGSQQVFVFHLVYIK